MELAQDLQKIREFLAGNHLSLLGVEIQPLKEEKKEFGRAFGAGVQRQQPLLLGVLQKILHKLPQLVFVPLDGGFQLCKLRVGGQQGGHTVDQGIFRGQRAGKSQQPLQPLFGGTIRAAQSLLLAGGHVVQRLLDDGDENLVLAFEVPVSGAAGQPCFFGDFRQRRAGKAFFVEKRFGGLQQLASCLQGIFFRTPHALAEALGLSDSEHYQQLLLGDGYFAAVFAVSNGDAIQVLAVAQKNGWDKPERYDSRFVL